MSEAIPTKPWREGVDVVRHQGHNYLVLHYSVDGPYHGCTTFNEDCVWIMRLGDVDPRPRTEGGQACFMSVAQLWKENPPQGAQTAGPFLGEWMEGEGSE